MTSGRGRPDAPSEHGRSPRPVQMDAWAGESGETEIGAVESAVAPAHLHKPTKCARVRALLSDGAEHSMRELQAVGGWRYGARLWELAQTGFAHEVRRDEAGEFHYRWRQP